MTAPIKLLFDENFGRPMVNDLGRLLRWYHDPVEFCHLFDHAPQGTFDEIWVPRIAAGEWTVISADRGKACGGHKLSRVCCDNFVTHILLSSTLHQRKQFEKARAILAVWPDIVKAARGPKGGRFALKCGQKGGIVLMEMWSSALHSVP